MCVVTFDPTAFALRYPVFAAVDPALLQMYFNEATIYLDNTDCSRVEDCAQRAILFNMLVAHIAALAGTNGAGSGYVGSIAGATEGSVSVTVNPLAVPGNNAAWFQQTNFGAAYWQATGRYRQAVYIPGQSFPAPRQFPYLPGDGGGYPWQR